MPVLQRLAHMPAAEIAYRLRERGRTEVERAGWHRPPAPSRLAKSFLAGCAARFYRGAGRPAAEVARHFPQWVEAAHREAETLCRGEIELLHLGPVTLAAPIDWHRDPYSGRTWERVFRAQHNPEFDAAGRDSKVVHELNRHQHLPRLAKAYLLTGNPRYAAEAVEQMLSWIGQNPPGAGINWQSSLEIAIRALSWLWTLFFVRESDALTETATATILASLFVQLDHVARHLSLYSSPNTHLIGEAAALLIAGLTLGQDDWRDTGAGILARTAENQIGPDGFHGENSSCYHCYALDFYLQAEILARQNSFPLPEIVSAKLGAMLRVLMHLTRPDGTLPLLGDDDGGRALALDCRTYRSFRDALCAGAVLFHKPSFKETCGGFAQESLWYFGESAWNDFRALRERTPQDAQLYCADAGYLVQRSGWQPSAGHLTFDFGGLGILTGGHSHADALSVTFFNRGREVLVDPGTYVYNGAPEWRRHFRSTAAHNTVTVDGQDQAQMSGTFRWRGALECHGSRGEGLPVDYVEGEHRGYSALEITHRRGVVQVPGEYWVLVDELRGAGEHRFDFHYHFGPQATIGSLECGTESRSALVWMPEAGVLFATFLSAPVQFELSAGWMSRGYGHKQPIQSLTATVHSPAPVWAATFLIPCERRPTLRRLPAARGEAIACLLHANDAEDLIVLPCGRSEVAVAGFRMAGEFFRARLAGGVIQNAVAIRSRRFQFHDANLLEDALCVPSAAL